MSNADTNYSYINRRAEVLYQQQIGKIYFVTSKIFVLLMAIQWAAGVVIAFGFGPYSLRGSEGFLHRQIEIALLLGLPLSSVSIYLALKQPYATFTRHLIAVNQMLCSGLLIDLMGGRIETHFHIFGSLAFLAVYRDWRILLTATIVAGVDHFTHHVFLAHWIYGVDAASPWLTVETVAWMAFANAFLAYQCIRATEELKTICGRQAAFEHTNKVFERKVAEEIVLRDDLKDSLARAEAASTAKGVFLATMSHEIRTPLNGIQGSLRLLGRGFLGREQRQFLEIANRSCEGLGAILNDVLDLSKIEAGKMDLHEEFTDLRSLVDHAVEGQLSRAEEKSIILTSVVAREVPERIKTDRLRLGQVLTNLIGNAIKFTQRGYVIVDVSCATRSDGQAELRFEVRDSGIGIPAHVMPSLFESFVQADGSTTKQYGGTGLGLKICRELVTKMNGKISFESEEGKGSVFWFTILTDSEPAELGTNRYFALDNTGITILLVGSNAVYQDVIARQLQSWGFFSVKITDLTQVVATVEASQETNSPISAVVITSFEILEIPEAIHKLMGQAFAPKLPPIAVLRGAARQTDSSLAEILAGYSIRQISSPVLQSTMFDTIVDLLVTRSSGLSSPATDDSYQNDAEESQSYPNAQVLVAEDNEINQVIIREFLKEHEIEPVIVANGSQALEAAQCASFDLIFLDCHMPEMDGFEAAEKIRKFYSDRSKPHIPIVALTADVTVESQERCTKVGMNHYISKPVDACKLANVLEKFLAPPQRSRPEVVEDFPSIQEQPPSIVASPIDLHDVSERFANNATLADMVLQRFGEQLQVDIARIQQVLQIGDAEGLFQVAHGLKGAAAAAGAVRVREHALALEEMGRDNQLSTVHETVSSLQQEVLSCITFLVENKKFRVGT